MRELKKTMSRIMREKKWNILILFVAGFALSSYVGIKILIYYLLFCGLTLVISFLYYRFLPKTLPCTFELPGTCRKGDKVTGYLHVVQEGRVPLFHGEARIRICRLFDGKEEEITLPIKLMVGEEGIAVFDVNTPYLGMMEFFLEEAAIYGLFGIGKKVILSSVKKRLMVLPETRELALEFPVFLDLDPEGEKMMEASLGYDPGLYQGIRPYRDGDSMKQIHWKLTEKTGELMVKELGLPMGRTPRLYLDTGLPDLDMRKIDALMEDYFSCSLALQKQGISHVLCWKNEGTAPQEYRVDPETMLEELLDPLFHITFWEDSIEEKDTFIYYMSYSENNVYGLYSLDGVDYLEIVRYPLKRRLWNEVK